MLGPVFAWLISYGPWGLIILMMFYDRYRFSHGDVVPARQVERELQGQRDLASSVDRLADSVEHNTDAVQGLQKGQESILYALEQFHQAREQQR